MSDAYVIAVDGISALRSLDDIPAEIRRAAMQAVNRTVTRTRTASAREMRRQVNFPARYLSGEDGRLAITKKATDADLEGVITGRFRPTSLARFARTKTVRKAGVSVEVAPGFARFMKRAFLIRLRSGSAALDTQSNLGLAIRLRPGEAIQNKRKMIQVQGNLYLLYGPSVSQVFAGVADDEVAEAGDFLEQEFLRLMEIQP